MSATKNKRAHDAPEIFAFTTTPNDRPKKRANFSPTPVAGDGPNQAFLQDKKSLKEQYFEKNNTSTIQKLRNSDTPEEAAAIIAEHLRIQGEIEALYGRPTGQVVAMGSDDCLQLGIATSPEAEKEDEYPPTFVRKFAADASGSIIQVAAGGLHSVALSEDGHAYTWGCNDDGAL